VRELAPDLWHWGARHPDWEPGEPWGPEVSSYAIDDGERLLLFDPLDVPSELQERASDREPVVVLTAPWHERDTQALVERLGAKVYAPPPDTQEDLMRKFDVSAERAAGGSPDLAWLLASDSVERHLFSAGERLPVGIDVFPGREHNDVVLWLGERRAVIAGDTLVDCGPGFQMADWLRDAVTREQVVAGLRPLLDLPVEFVLPAHGAPTDRAALERALLAPLS
jgi:glyoxylase-like metal-dependent hydrolase (beta-lactamase superfamily II)